MGLPIPSDMAASSGAANPLAPFMAPPTAAGGHSGPAHQSAAMPDMPSDINVEEARYSCGLAFPLCVLACLPTVISSRLVKVPCASLGCKRLRLAEA